MPDELSLSLWLRDFKAANMLRHFEELLRVFPFSTQRPGIASLRIDAIEFAEPPAFETAFPAGADVETVIALCREFEHDDAAYVVEGWWDLFQNEGGWQLTPSPVVLICFGPAFENEAGDHLRIDVGPDFHFLPEPGAPGSERASKSNIKGLLRLSLEIQESLPIENRRLWSESGEDFAAHLDDALA